MKVKCLQGNLSHGLAMANQIVNARTTMPITQNILMVAIEGAIKMQATNLQTSLTTWVPAEVEETGGITVPLKLLHEFISTLPNDVVELNGHTEDPEANALLTLKCLRNKAHINGTLTDQFPPIPEVERESSLEVKASEFSTAIARTEFCAAKEDNRPVLTGVNIRFHDQEFIMAAADGFRLAVQQGNLENPVDEPFEVNLPANFLKRLRTIQGDSDEPVHIHMPQNRKQALFQFITAAHGELRVEMTTLLLDGEYPSYQDLIPESSSVHAVMDSSRLMQAVRSTSIFTKNNFNKITLQMEQEGEDGKPTTTIYGEGEETGDSRAVVEMEELQGNPMQISFNHQYLKDVLSITEKSNIRMETNSARAPGVFRLVDSEQYTHVIMPIMPA